MAQRGADGHLSYAGVGDLAHQTECLGAGIPCDAYSLVPVGALQYYLGDNGPRLYVVERGGFIEQPLVGREWRSLARIAALAFDRYQQRRLFAADEGSGAGEDVEVEAETGAEDVLAEQTVFPRLLYRVIQRLYGERVLRAHIGVTLADVAYGKSPDEHTFNKGVRIAFQDGAVHERAGVSFVSVADDELLVSLSAAHHAPLASGGEACAASSSQSGLENFLYYIFRFHRGQRFDEGPVAVESYVLLDAPRVDQSVEEKDDPSLALVELDVLVGRGRLVGDGVHVYQALHYLSAHQVLLDNLINVGAANPGIEDVARGNGDVGPLFTEAAAADLGHVYPDALFQPSPLDGFTESVLDFIGARSRTSCSATDEDVYLAGLLELGKIRVFSDSQKRPDPLLDLLEVL